MITNHNHQKGDRQQGFYRSFLQNTSLLPCCLHNPQELVRQMLFSHSFFHGAVPVDTFHRGIK